MKKKNNIIKKDLETIKFQMEDFFNSLEENEKKDFLSECSVIFSNKNFKRVCDEVGSREIIETVNGAVTAEDLAYGRGKVHGVALIFEIFANYNAMHQDNIKQEEKFNKQDLI